MSSFYIDYDGKLKKKKDEEKTTTGQMVDFYVDYDGQIRQREKEIDAELAPTKPTEKTKKRTWFQKGLFEDGYQFGDITKTIIGSVTDLGENFGAGVLEMGEKAIDSLAVAGQYVAQGQYYQNGGAYQSIEQQRIAEQSFDAGKEWAKDFAKKDLYSGEKIAETIITNPVESITGVDVGKSSVFGEKSDALAQSAGQLAGTAALQAVGVPWWLTTGVTSAGGEIENALNQGATLEEATLSGIITAGADILTEKISGGIKFGGKTLDEGLTKTLARSITNKYVRTAAKLGIDAVGEGAEEWIAQDISTFGKWLTYQNDEELSKLLFSEEAMDEKIEAFIGGAVLGGGSSTFQAVRSASSKANPEGKDFVTGFTKTEQAVVDKVYAERVAEYEKQNGKATQRNKTEIYDAVVKDMDKGYISTDTIEEALGGDTFKAYQDAVKSETAVKEEYEKLANTPKGELTHIQEKRLAELEAQIEAEPKSKALKQQLSESAFNLAKDSRLVETYNEQERRTQAFQADLTKYDAKQAEVVKKAVESGILNNTNRTHEFVDLVAKISADKGVSFDFANNAKIKESGFAVDGATVNGFVTDSGITVNIQSAKALNTVVGHEITHILEGTELYDGLQKAVVEYAKTKGEYDSRLAAITKLYEGKNADVNKELVADLVGDYLFTDSDFIARLSTENRNVFQKIYDEIKYLAKVATAGSKEARQLEKAKRAFEKAYKESKGDSKTEIDAAELQTDAVKYSVSVTDENLIDFLENQEHITTYKAMQVIDGELYPPMAAKVKGEDGKYRLTNPRKLGEWQQAVEDTANIKVKSNGIGYYTLNKGNGKSIDAAYNPYEHSSNLVLNDQFEEAYQRPNLVTVECVIPVSEMTSGYRAEHAKDTTGIMDWKAGTVASKLKNNQRKVYLSRWIKPVRILSDAETAAMYKDIVGDTPVPFNVVTPGLLSELEKVGVNIDYEGSPNYRSHQRRKTEKNTTGKGDVKYALSADTEGNKLTKGQQEYFKDSKVVDENGNLKVMYHGSNAQFTSFDRSKAKGSGLYGKGFYFTDSDTHAKTYGNLYSVYLNIRNPLKYGETTVSRDQVRNYLKAVAENEDYSIENYGTYNVEEVLNTVMGKASNGDAFQIIQDINATAIGDMVEAAELFNSINGTSFDGIVVPTETVAFYPEQIKSTANTNPTADTDIRYSISADTDRAYLDAVKRGDMETAQKMVNEAAEAAGYTTDTSWKMQHSAPNSKYDVSLADIKESGLVPDDYWTHPEWYTSSAEERESFYKVRSAIELQERLVASGKQHRNAYITVYRAVDKTKNTKEEAIRNGDWVTPSRDYAVNEGLDNPNGYRIIAQRVPIKDLYWDGNSIAELGYDDGNTYAYADTKNNRKLLDAVTYDEFDQVIPLSKRFNKRKWETEYSVSAEGSTQKQYGNYNVYGKDIALQEDIAPVREDIQPKAQTEEEMFPDDKEPLSEVDAAAMNYEALWSMTDEDAPPVMEEPYTEDIEPSYISDPLKDKTWKEVGKRNVKAYSFEHPEVRPFFKQAAEGMLTDLLSNTLKGQKIYSWNDGLLTVTGQERWTSDAIAKLRDNAKMSYKDIERGLRAIIAGNGAENNAASKRIELVISEELFNGYIDHTSGYKIPADEDYINLLDEMQNAEANAGSFDSLMEVADDIAPPIEEDIAPVKETVTEPEVTEESTVAEEAPEEDTRAIFTVQQRLEAKLENAEKALEELKKKQSEYNASLEGEIEAISQELNKKKNLNTKVAQDLMKRIIRKEEMRENINADYSKRIADQQVKVAKLKEEVKSGESPTEQAAMRAELHENMIDNIKSAFAENGFDFDKVLENAKDLSTFSTVDNTPQRVLEKSLGYKEGKVLADLTVNKVAENETKAIRWLNTITDRKNGLLAQLVKEYNIKPGSKESAAAQMYAEGFFVNDDNEIIAYGDKELAIDFPDAKVRKNIKGLARDPRIREFYDGALAAINESRARNAYPEIKPLKNYFLHFRAMDDTFSRLGIPFNPNDIKAKDLPTDLNGVTADLKPGQPYFASSMHRKGKRTSFDLLGGIEQYATGASRQIFHIDDIQTLRALRNYVADTFGQAKGLEDLDLMTEEEAEAKIKEVYGAHLSTFAKFLNEEANVIAGKTALTDRGLEGIIGRRGITFLDSLNKQVGANMIGFNISSSLTNLIAPVQAFAKSNKAAFIKAMAQTASNRLKAIKGQSDGFAENSPVMIRRKGADRFARTPWQKVSDMGYVFMSAVDGVSTEIIARAKYNELTKKGMDSEQAHIETDKWVSRLMGDRSLGQQPQLYNSKMLGMFTKFQLEVRNQLDAQFYDTIQEAKLSNEEVKNELERNAKTAAKVTKTFVELAVLQHLFGKAFESVAGYNPAFDIISALIKAFGFDDDEDDDDTFTDNLWEGAQELLGDLPYTSTLTGGRIPISSALPVEQFITGKDSYGNEKSRWETLGEAAPYYLMPGGYGQFKKTSQGLSMFDDDLPIAGSYTDSGNLRFPVAPTLPNIAQAAVFGQYASQNARDYFDNEYAPLKEKQIQEFIDLDIPIKEYRDIREDLADKSTLGEKVAYIATLDLPIDKKNILVNNAANREEPIDMSDYGEYTDWGEFDYAKKYPDKYAFLQANGITVKQYNKFTDDEKEAWSWAYQNPEKFALSKSIASDVVKYRSYTEALSDITADKDENGKSISGSRKEKVISYINNLDADYGEKIILFKSEYPSDDTYNYEIVEYLGSREDITYDEMITILYELGFTVKDGRAYWD